MCGSRSRRKSWNVPSDHGIPACEIVVDPFVMPIGAINQAGCRSCAWWTGCAPNSRSTPLAPASNISFGLPNRDGINAAFLTMAMGAGLTSAITNPLHVDVIRACMGADVMLGHDPDCARWIRRFRDFARGRARSVETGPAFSPRAASTSAPSISRPRSAAASDYSRLRVRTTRCGRSKGPLIAGGRYDGLLSWLGAREPIRRLGFVGLDRGAGGLRRRGMSATPLLAIPSKGRLQQNAAPSSARSGLKLIKPRGARDIPWRHRRIDGVEIGLSVGGGNRPRKLAQGAVIPATHGEDLVRETIARRRPAGRVHRSARLRFRQCRRPPCRKPGSTCPAWATSTMLATAFRSSTSAKCGSPPNTPN